MTCSSRALSSPKLYPKQTQRCQNARMTSYKCLLGFSLEIRIKSGVYFEILNGILERITGHVPKSCSQHMAWHQTSLWITKNHVKPWGWAGNCRQLTLNYLQNKALNTAVIVEILPRYEDLDGEIENSLHSSHQNILVCQQLKMKIQYLHASLKGC